MASSPSSPNFSHRSFVDTGRSENAGCPAQQHDSGYVMLCNNKTENECIKYNVFGNSVRLYKEMERYVIPLKTLVFLYNIQKKQFVRGIFIATSKVGKSICKKVDWEKNYKAQFFVKNVYPIEDIQGIRKNRRRKNIVYKKEIENMLNQSYINVEKLYKEISKTNMKKNMYNNADDGSINNNTYNNNHENRKLKWWKSVRSSYENVHIIDGNLQLKSQENGDLLPDTYFYVTTLNIAKVAIQEIKDNCVETSHYSVGLDFQIESNTGNITLIQIVGYKMIPVILDILIDTDLLLHSGIKEIICGSQYKKIVVDFRSYAEALFKQFRIELNIVVDIQLAFQSYEQNRTTRRSLNYILSEILEEESDESVNVLHDYDGWSHRPLSKKFKAYAARTVQYLHEVLEVLNLYGINDSNQIELSGVGISNLLKRLGKGSRSFELDEIAERFWNYLEMNSQRRFECQNKMKLQIVYESWRQTHNLRGGFGSIFHRLCGRRMRKIARLLPGDDRDVVVFLMDISDPNEAKKYRESIAEMITEQRVEIEADKGDISVNVVKSFPKITYPGTKISATVEINNTSCQQSRLFLSITTLAEGNNTVSKTSKFYSFFNVPEIKDGGYIIKPGKRIRFPITCTPTRLGIKRDILQFNFSTLNNERFSIGRFVEIQTGDVELYEELKASSPYRKKIVSRKQKYNPNSKVEDEPGNKPKIARKPWVKNCGQHDISRHLEDKVVYGEIKEYLESLKEEDLYKYCELMHSLLWLEERQMIIDLQSFDMIRVPLEKSGRHLKLRVPGLAENRPSVLYGDKVICQLNGQFKKYAGYAYIIERDKVWLKFPEKFWNSYSNNTPTNIHFILARTLLRLQHESLESNVIKLGQQVLFPSTTIPCHESRKLKEILRPYNRNLNQEQQQAVENALSGKSRPCPYIIYGPPGTGKTVTAVELILQAVKRTLVGIKILVTAPSNTAADVICRRLASKLSALEMIRLMAYSRRIDETTEVVRRYCLIEDEHFVIPDKKEELLKYSVVVATLSTASRLPFSLGLSRGSFDICIVDEAGQAPEPEALAAAASLLDIKKGGQLILCGDPKQLGPIIHSKLASENGLGMSLLERLSLRKVYEKKDAKVMTKLLRNYRSHPDILSLPNKLFYEGELVPVGDKALTHSFSDWEHLPQADFPILFHGVEGKDEREGNSPSWFNIHEIARVMEYVKLLLNTTKNPIRSMDEIGIIAPYRKQVQKIKIGLKLMDSIKNKDPRNIMVGSTEQFQGQEKRVIIISTVRSSKEYLQFDERHSIGFLANEKRFNVAVTRAKALLIIIGHPSVLATDKNWKALIKLCYDRHAYIGPSLNISGVTPEIENEKIDQQYDTHAKNLALLTSNLTIDDEENLEAEMEANTSVRIEYENIGFRRDHE